jgi:hypothetical protein
MSIVSPRNSNALDCLSSLKGKLARPDFERACLERFREAGNISHKSAQFFAANAVREYLAHHCIRYGAEGHEWTQEAARKLADQEMSYWDEPQS